jgi:hypothetical protein
MNRQMREACMEARLTPQQPTILCKIGQVWNLSANWGRLDYGKNPYFCYDQYQSCAVRRSFLVGHFPAAYPNWRISAAAFQINFHFHKSF